MRVINTVRFLLAASIIGLASCNQVIVPEAEWLSELGSTEKVRLDFTIENPSSIGLPSLSENETLSVFSLFAPEENCKFTYSNTSLSGEVPQGGKLVALYPYSENVAVEVKGGQVILSTAVPSELNFIEKIVPDETSVVSELSETGVLEDIAVGVNSGEGFKFKSIYGRIILPIKSTSQYVTVKSIKLEGLGGERISGDIKISVSDELTLSVVSASGTSVVYKGDITIHENETKYVTFKVIPQNFSEGIKLTLTKSDNVAVEQKFESVSVSVNEEFKLGEFVFENLIRDYYVEYKAGQQVFIDGYDCKEYNAETETGRIYFNTPEIPESLLVDNKIISSVKISAKVTSIGGYAFSGMANLESMSVEDNSELNYIGESVFYGCKNCNFDFSKATKLEHIGKNTFRNCSGIMSYDFPESVKRIEQGAFRNLSWTEVIIKEGVETLGTENGGQGILQECTGITKLDLPSTLKTVEKNGLKIETKNPGYILICRAVEPPSINGGTFLSDNLTAIYVPKNSVENYKSAKQWSNKKGKIKPLSDLSE